ncbi:hypothetical protein CY34DRAFT_557395 [Suillus luteus UH-Slu-Lm8-n1]|uniref:Uncharacterized protein n=1 Tax=Suillus luteus UH-Slu-Lm8-n1 TaxID=930992 RepID=A0A0D0A246_9AGAM|nr:hypothetical protein CY34DRAFT_557395 [Suillus luteus UH-Slu-Lm8-n1]
MGQLVVTFAVHHPRLPCFHHQSTCTIKPKDKHIGAHHSIPKWCERAVRYMAVGEIEIWNADMNEVSSRGKLNTALNCTSRTRPLHHLNGKFFVAPTAGER